MITLTKNEERGKTKFDWLESYHSFSFGEYYDPDNINFGPIRVMNDDIIQPGKGFPTHPHSDMEIITFVTEGAVAHKDSVGNKEVIQKNEVQGMTAGSGIFHSEFNHSDTDILKLYQVWILPNTKGLKPAYQQIKFSDEQKNNNLLKVVSGVKEEGVIFINQNVDIYLGDFETGMEKEIQIKEGRGLYIHLISGQISLPSVSLFPGDAVKITEENIAQITADSKSNILLFDVPMQL